MIQGIFDRLWHLPRGVSYVPQTWTRWSNKWPNGPSGVDPMKTIAMKFLSVFAVAALLGGVAITAGCPAADGSSSDGE